MIGRGEVVGGSEGVRWWEGRGVGCGGSWGWRMFLFATDMFAGHQVIQCPWLCSI